MEIEIETGEKKERRTDKGELLRLVKTELNGLFFLHFFSSFVFDEERRKWGMWWLSFIALVLPPPRVMSGFELHFLLRVD